VDASVLVLASGDPPDALLDEHPARNTVAESAARQRPFVAKRRFDSEVREVRDTARY